ncbi:MAG: molybdopterin cofactor-binding domain-containing protein [Alphaproteobacteria bacterium]
MGDRKATDAAFAKAKHIARLSLVNNRVVVASLEPRSAIGDYDQANDRYVLYAPSRGVRSLQAQLANDIFKVPLDRVRVVTGDVGGGFGMKIFLFPEQALVLFAARQIRRPVKWSSSRAEAFLSDTQGRDHVTDAELALDADGRFLAVRVSTMVNIGAYVSNFIGLVSTGGSYLLPGVYAMGAMHSRVRTVFTNTVPVDAYRGAGRPEAAYVVERMVDVAAREMGLSPDEIRRRNFIPTQAMPAKTAAGVIYDSGDFIKIMDGAMAAADWAGFAKRRTEAKARGKLRGIGMSYYVERCGGGGDEMAEIRFDQGGSATVLIGNQTNGQGHETAYAQIVSEKLGLPMDRIRVVQGDTDLIVYGRGTGGSRALPIGGNAVMLAADRVIARGKTLAAHQLEAAEADIEFADGKFTVAGTDRSMGFADVVRLAFTPHKLPPGIAPGLDERANFMPKDATFPNGCHICEVEVDPETGHIRVDRYTVMDDFGRVVNPLLLAGQVHGGVAQGIGQALLEHVVYDRDSGQLLTGAFIDYAIPRADDLPNYGFAYNEILCRNNPLGIKGAGEAGAIGAPPTVINAIVDALAERGVRSIDMPATPERVWRALGGGQAA